MPPRATRPVAWAVWTSSQSLYEKARPLWGAGPFRVSVPMTVQFHTQHAAPGVSHRTLAGGICGWLNLRISNRWDAADMESAGGPFIASEALAAGDLTFRELRRFHAAVYPGIWVLRSIDLSPVDRARAAWLWSGRRGVVAGISASAVWGAKWIEPDTAAELIHTNRRPPPLIRVYSSTLLEGEIAEVNGIPITTPARTAFDIGRRLRLEPAVQRIDALMNATGLTADEIADVMTRHPGARGVRLLHRTLSLVDAGAESPQETRLRLAIVRAGLPAPETQIWFPDLRIRVDMGWRKWKVAVEYDGVQHWLDSRQRAWDIERTALLEERGWAVVRVSAEMLARPQVIIDRIRAKLGDCAA